MNPLSAAFDVSKPSLFTSIAGVTNAVFSQYTEGSRHVYDQLLKIFDSFDLEHYLFAGSLVGYLRNGKMPPWVDDLDVILFEDQIALFEEKVVPHLRECGFHVFKPEKFQTGGYHILSMMTGSSRELSIPFTDEISVQVPWAQVDVFFTNVDSDGFIRNSSGWGLYHQKDIPVDWVKPGKVVRLEDWSVRVFSEYEKDIYKEYGDVLNNLVISTHDRTFLRIDGIPYGRVAEEFDSLYVECAGRLPPLIKPADVISYSPVEQVKYIPKQDESFESILKGVLSCRASSVELSQPNHLFWAMDMKRILPSLNVEGVVAEERFASRATHMRAYFDKISGASPNVHDVVERQIRKLSMESLNG